MACHAVPRVMMYQGDARVPLEEEVILRGFLEGYDGKLTCEIMVDSFV